MSEINSSLPIRSEADGTDERVHVKLVDFSDPDGADKQVEVSEKLVHTRVFGEDHAGNKVQLELSEEGKPNADGEYDAVNNTEPNSAGLIAHSRGAAIDETSQNQRTTAVGGDNDKVAMDVAISDSNGNNFSEDNPLPVYAAESPGDEIDVYDQAVDVAKDANANHDYTVTALKTLKDIEVDCSGSGKARFELQVETGVATGIYNAVMVKFNSTAKPNVTLRSKKKVAAGVKVRVVKTNLDNQTQDLYSQIMGIEF